jgi:hypothetical protein
MLEREIAAFVEWTNAIYPTNTATLPVTQQRAIYDRYAAAFTPPLPAGLRVENATFRASSGQSGCGYTGLVPKVRSQQASCCTSTAVALWSARWIATKL